MQKERLKKYAELIVKCGLNVQQGQEVNVQCGLDQPEFVPPRSRRSGRIERHRQQKDFSGADGALPDIKALYRQARK